MCEWAGKSHTRGEKDGQLLKCARYLPGCIRCDFCVLSSWRPHNYSRRYVLLIILILQIQKWRHGAVKKLAPNYKASSVQAGTQTLVPDGGQEWPAGP